MREKGLDEAPRYRIKMYELAACEWQDHYWWRFVSIALGDYPVVVLCERCGRTPYEALDELRIVK